MKWACALQTNFDVSFDIIATRRCPKYSIISCRQNHCVLLVCSIAEIKSICVVSRNEDFCNWCVNAILLHRRPPKSVILCCKHHFLQKEFRFIFQGKYNLKNYRSTSRAIVWCWILAMAKHLVFSSVKLRLTKSWNDQANSMHMKVQKYLNV